MLNRVIESIYRVTAAATIAAGAAVFILALSGM